MLLPVLGKVVAGTFAIVIGSGKPLLRYQLYSLFPELSRISSLGNSPHSDTSAFCLKNLFGVHLF